MSFPQRFRQPTSIDNYTGETDPRVWLNDYRLACQLGGATTDEVIIRNLPLHLAESARTWLEHLPASQTHNWDGPHLRGELLGHVRAPWKLLGSARMHPEARRVTPGLRTALLQALHGAPECGPVRDRARLTRGHDLPGPCARAWTQPAARLERAVQHRHQLRLM
jgi:hypothetical protein